MTRAPLNIAELKATARPTSSRGTISEKNDCRIGMSTALTVPRATARTIKSGIDITPNATKSA